MKPFRTNFLQAVHLKTKAELNEQKRNKNSRANERSYGRRETGSPVTMYYLTNLTWLTWSTLTTVNFLFLRYHTCPLRLYFFMDVL